MSKIRKLTPRILKSIIKEEKLKLGNRVKNRRKTSDNIERDIDAVTKIALLEARHLLKIKKLREKRKRLKKLIARKVKK